MKIIKNIYPCPAKDDHAKEIVLTFERLKSSSDDVFVPTLEPVDKIHEATIHFVCLVEYK